VAGSTQEANRQYWTSSILQFPSRLAVDGVLRQYCSHGKPSKAPTVLRGSLVVVVKLTLKIIEYIVNIDKPVSLQQ
jgi:hypothetical protein